MKKRLVSLFLVIALLISFPLIGVSAEDSGAKILNGVALGDSVAAFYGIEEEDGYVAQLSAILTAAGIENNFTNLAVSGYDSAALLVQLAKKDVLAQLADADIITLNIGGNNILIPLIEMIKQELSALDISDISKAPPAVMMAFASKKLSDEQIAFLGEGAAAFAKDFPAIIGILRTAAPDAKILVNTVYNPIPSAIGLYESAETILSLINGAIIKNAEEGGYITADICAAYKAASGTITNFDVASGSFDIHPNAAGHALIAETIANKLAGGDVSETTEAKTEAKTETESQTAPAYLTRGEGVAAIMNIIAGFLPDISKTADDKTSIFSDVPPEHKNFEAIMAAKACGIILGTGNGIFNADDIMKREDFAVILFRIMSIVSDKNVADIIAKTDLTQIMAIAADFGEISDYAQEAISAAISLGIITVEDGTVNPDGGITTAFINSAIANILKLIKG